MDKFREIPKQYDASDVDSEIAILTKSKDFWKSEAVFWKDKYEALSQKQEITKEEN